jgi:hypothetical protein
MSTSTSRWTSNGIEANMLGKFSIQVLPSQDEVSIWLMPDGSADSVVDAIHQNKKMKRVAFEHTLSWRIVLVCQKPLIANNGESRAATPSLGRAHHEVTPVLEINLQDIIKVNSRGPEHITPSVAEDGVDVGIPVIDMIVHAVAGDVVLPPMEREFLSKLTIIETHGVAPNGIGTAAIFERLSI